MKIYLFLLLSLFSSRYMGLPQDKDLEIKGIVTDLSGIPIKDHPVIFKYAIERPYQDTTYTDGEGKFSYLIKNAKGLGNSFLYLVYVNDCNNSSTEVKVTAVNPIANFRICINR